MQDSNGENKGAEEPVSYIDVLNFALHNCSEEHRSVSNPDHCDQDINWPFQFCVFLALREAQRQADGCGQNNQLPAPECKGNQRAAP